MLRCPDCRGTSTVTMTKDHDGREVFRCVACPFHATLGTPWNPAATTQVGRLFEANTIPLGQP